MSFTYYGEYLKKVREHAGLSQEKLADGIINLQSLNRIENNRAGVSPGTFQALTSKCGASTEVFPLFVNWVDFECFYELCKADMWLDSWQVNEAYRCLKLVDERDFAGNLIYYQKWLCCYALMLIRSGDEHYTQILDILKYALEITHKKMMFEDIKKECFTVTEIILLTTIAEMCFMIKSKETGLTICLQLLEYLDNMALSYSEKTSLSLGVQKVYILFLLQDNKYSLANEKAEKLRTSTLVNMIERHIIEAAFLHGLTKFLLGDKERGLHYLKAAYYSGDAIKSQFANVGNSILRVLDIKIPELEEAIVFCKEREDFLLPDLTRMISLYDVECNYNSPNVITLGKLIRRKRKEQKLSMRVLCQGLCSNSALSKIENDTLQPSVFLARALLQRLGMSDDVFAFFVSENEEVQYRLEKKIAGAERYESQTIKTILQEMKDALSVKNPIFEQFYTNNMIFYEQGTNIRYLRILDNIQKTLPGFSPDDMTSYRLSKNELSYIISYCMALRKEKSETMAIKVLYRLMEYIMQDFNDDLLKNSVIGIIFATLINALGVQNRNSEIIELLPYIDNKILYGHTQCLPTIYAHISIIYNEDREKNPFGEYCLYTYYLFVLHEMDASEKYLENMIKATGTKITV